MLKRVFIGGLWGSLVSFPIFFFFQSWFGVQQLLAAVLTGVTISLVLEAFIPTGFPIPKDITTFTCLGLSAFCLWVVMDGIVTGEIHNLPRSRGGFGQPGFSHKSSWDSNPLDFGANFLAWGAFGAIVIGIPIYWYRKAIRDTSGISSPAFDKFDDTIEKLQKWSPSNASVIAVFIIAFCSILVFFYLLILLGS